MSNENAPLPAIPAKRYFTIGEVSELCGVKAYVLRYWEQEFTQLKPMKRRGNRRYYQHHEVLLIRRIRDLLYEQGFTISGARNQLVDAAGGHAHALSGSSAGAPVEASPTGELNDVPDLSDGDDLDEATLDAMAEDDIATIQRARMEVVEAPVTRARRVVARAPSVAAEGAVVRSNSAADTACGAADDAQQVSTRAPHGSTGAPSPAPLDMVYSAGQVRTELMAIRSLLED
jgi:DNA-binding transcriptional MerR regulator